MSVWQDAQSVIDQWEEELEAQFKNKDFMRPSKGGISKYRNTMSKKTFNLITACIGGVQAIGVAIVTYTEPAYATAINGAIVIIGTAAVEVCNLFTKAE